MGSKERCLMKFDPNTPPPEFHWATYTPNRRPQFKTHTKKSHAKNAAGQRDQVIIYQWNVEKGKWIDVFIWDRKESVGHCEECGVEFISWKEAKEKGIPAVYRSTIWDKREGADFTMIEVCNQCWPKLRKIR